MSPKRLREHAPGLGVPFVFRLMGTGGRFGPHRFVRWMVRDQQAARESLCQIMRWDFDRVIVAHGDILESGGRQKVRDAFGFILGAASRARWGGFGEKFNRVCSGVHILGDGSSGRLSIG